MPSKLFVFVFIGTQPPWLEKHSFRDKSILKSNIVVLPSHKLISNYLFLWKISTKKNSTYVKNKSYKFYINVIKIKKKIYHILIYAALGGVW